MLAPEDDEPPLDDGADAHAEVSSSPAVIVSDETRAAVHRAPER